MNSTKNGDCSGGKNPGMRRLLFVGLLIAGVLAWYAGGAIRTARAAAATKSAQDGVYTEDQAKHGKTEYSQSCGGCHMDDLSGSGQAPPLVGDAFSQYWDGHTVADLYDTTHTTMPMDKPDSLTPEAYLDIIAFMLQSNNYPPGKEALKNDPEALKNIVIGKKSSQ